MIAIEPLAPGDFTRVPWKNGRGALTVIDRSVSEGWDRTAPIWHFGRTTIVEDGPFSDYSGFERLQVAIDGSGLVLVAADHEIDLATPFTVVRYDGGLPVRTRLTSGPVEVVNLIANKTLFDIDLRVCRASDTSLIARGRHVAYAPKGAARVTIGSETFALPENHALRIRSDRVGSLRVEDGIVLLGSILPLG
jgi:environmental stress-induced protein Ves